VESRSHVAIVDNDPDMRISLSLLLGSLGYDPILFETANELLSSPKLSTIRCVISDLKMPEMDGIELARKFGGVSRAPILIITGIVSSVIEKRASDAGVHRVFTKPFEADDLINELAGILR
jgi:FixJ family two-component response regulator